MFLPVHPYVTLPRGKYLFMYRIYICGSYIKSDEYLAWRSSVRCSCLLFLIGHGDDALHLAVASPSHLVRHITHNLFF